MREALTEIDRRLANIVRIGKVTAFQAGAVDGSAVPMVQVDIGDLVTDWLPLAMSRAGGNASYDTPEVGEQVMLFAPSGELANATVMGSIPQTSKPSKFIDQDKTGYAWSDGAFQTYDRAGHHYKIDIPDAGDLVLHIGAATLVLNNTSITSTIGAASLAMTNDAITANIGASTLTIIDGKATLATNEFDVNSPLSKFSGQVHVGGTLIVDGASTLTGAVTASGGVGVAGNVTVTGGDVKADLISLKLHKTSLVTVGVGVGGPPTP